VQDACLRGSVIHSEIELALTGRQSMEYKIEDWVRLGIPDYINNLLGFIQELNEDKEDMEVEKVVSHTAGYAGTADLICRYQGEMTVIDWKTTRHHNDVGEKEKKSAYYKGADMQISAYGAAYNQDARRPQVTQGLIVVAYSWREPDLIKLDANDLRNRVSQFGERLSTFKILEPELYA